jgi:hypothetical protein
MAYSEHLCLAKSMLRCVHQAAMSLSARAAVLADLGLADPTLVTCALAAVWCAALPPCMHHLSAPTCLLRSCAPTLLSWLHVSRQSTAIVCMH